MAFLRQTTKLTSAAAGDGGSQDKRRRGQLPGLMPLKNRQTALEDGRPVAVGNRDEVRHVVVGQRPGAYADPSERAIRLRHQRRTDPGRDKRENRLHRVSSRSAVSHDGASRVIAAAFPEAGLPVRTAVGVVSLALDAPVEVELILTLDDAR